MIETVLYFRAYLLVIVCASIIVGALTLINCCAASFFRMFLLAILGASISVVALTLINCYAAPMVTGGWAPEMEEVVGYTIVKTAQRCSCSAFFAHFIVSSFSKAARRARNMQPWRFWGFLWRRLSWISSSCRELSADDV